MKKIISSILSLTLVTAMLVTPGVSKAATVTNGGSTSVSTTVTADFSNGYFTVAIPLQLTLLRDSANPGLYKASTDVSAYGIIPKGKKIYAEPSANQVLTSKTDNTTTTALSIVNTSGYKAFCSAEDTATAAAPKLSSSSTSMSKMSFEFSASPTKAHQYENRNVNFTISCKA